MLPKAAAAEDDDDDVSMGKTTGDQVQIALARSVSQERQKGAAGGQEPNLGTAICPFLQSRNSQSPKILTSSWTLMVTKLSGTGSRWHEGPAPTSGACFPNPAP